MNRGPKTNPESTQEATINRILNEFTERFEFYKNSPEAYQAFEDGVTTFTDDEDKKRKAKALLETAVQKTETRLRRINILLASGFFSISQDGQKNAFESFLERLKTSGLDQNPFRLIDEEGDSQLLFLELEPLLQTLNAIANCTQQTVMPLSEEVLLSIDDTQNAILSETEEEPTDPDVEDENTTPAEEKVADKKPSKEELIAAYQEAKNEFFAINREVGNIENAIAKLGWWQLLWEKNRQEKTRLQVELEAKIAERDRARVEVKRAKAAVDSAKSTVRVATVVTEVTTQLPEQAPASTTPKKTAPTGGFATMVEDILQRQAEQEALEEAQAAEAKAKAEQNHKALEAARTQKEADLAKAKAALAKMNGITGFFRSMFNWGEKDRLEREVARLSAELKVKRAQSPTKPEHIPGVLEWFRTSTAAQVSAVLVASSLLGTAFSMRNSTHSTDSVPTASSASIADTTQPDIQPEIAPASTSEKTRFTSEPGNTIWDAVQDAGLTGEALTKTTNDIVVQAYADANGSLGEHLNNPADFQKVVKQMKAWGGYSKVLESAEGQTTIAGFLNAVEQAHGEKVADLVEANIASTFDPMDAPHAPSMIKAALNTHE